MFLLICILIWLFIETSFKQLRKNKNRNTIMLVYEEVFIAMNAKDQSNWSEETVTQA